MYYLGIDLGGTNVAAGVVDDEYKIISKASVPTNADKGVDVIIKNIADAANKAIAGAGITVQQIESIGIGSPGAIDSKNGIVDFAGNLGFDKTPLAKLVGEYFPNKKILIENDANVAAYAEMIAGAAKGTKDSVTVTLGTGVGGGMIIDGKIYSGFNGKGGELGHIVIERDGRPCTCGRRGCFEAYASVTALIRFTKEEMERDKDSVMWQLVSGDISRVSGRTAFDAMRKGDATATYVVGGYLRSVSIGIADIINMLQPEVLCIGGGISNEGDTLLMPVKKMVAKEVFTSHSNSTTDIRIAMLGNDAGIIGAALLK